MERAYEEEAREDLLHGLLRRRPRRPDHGAALSRRFRRHLCPCARHQLGRPAACRHAHRGLRPWARAGSIRRRSSSLAMPCAPPATRRTASDDALVQDPRRLQGGVQGRRRCAAPAARAATNVSATRRSRRSSTLHATYKFPFPLANGLDDYPGWGVSAARTRPAFGPTGGWVGVVARQAAPPAQPPVPRERHRLGLRCRRDPICVRP